MNETVLCKDCSHSFRKFKDWFILGSNEYAYTCRKSFKPEHFEPSPVVGAKKIEAKYESCAVARVGRPDRDDRCGETGKWWTPKDKKDLFTYIKRI
jgi:hypothetical protein